jgi:protein-S-isoprenylcysteine O-methyltransferase Ste14
MVVRGILSAALFGSTLCIILPWLIARCTWNLLAEFGGWRLIGFVPLVVGVFICLYCVATLIIKGQGTSSPFYPTRKLVVRGLYRYSRNPMYIGGVLLLIGEAIIWASPLLLAYAAVLAVSAHLFVVYYEEPSLVRRFGAEYREYLKRSPRWFSWPSQRDEHAD